MLKENFLCIMYYKIYNIKVYIKNRIIILITYKNIDKLFIKYFIYKLLFNCKYKFICCNSNIMFKNNLKKFIIKIK